MSTEHILWVAFGAVIALALTAFMYFFKNKKKDVHRWWYAPFRFLTLFAGILLLINPSFRQVSYEIDKPYLVLAVDNSSSIEELAQQNTQLDLLNRFQEDAALKERFQIRRHVFDDGLRTDTLITHSGAQSNLDSALRSLQNIYTESPVVLLSDGNQTFGNDYSYTIANQKSPVFPMILGDSIQAVDLKIHRLNVNKYAFLKNSFPVEVMINYNGDTPVSSRLVIKNGNTTVFSRNVALGPSNKAVVVEATVQANRVGLQRLSATIEPLQNEKNTVNNMRFFAVEVIDQQTKVAIVSDISHPDLGVLKTAIESNEQRSATIVHPADLVNNLTEYQTILLYQPNATFKRVMERLAQTKQNVFFICGPNTDLSFLNANQAIFTQQYTRQIDDVVPSLHNGFTGFILEDIGFSGFPPLQSEFGDILVRIEHNVFLYKNIGGVDTKEPLWVTFDRQGQRGAILFGEGIWRWRMKSFMDNGSFEDFDAMIGKFIQFLTTNNRKDRLTLDYETFHYGSSSAKVDAQFFDKNFVFNPNARLNITVVNTESEESVQYPLLLKNNLFRVDLSSLPPGNYRFTITPEGERISRSGSFEIVPFDVEKQFLNADVTKLRQLATNTGGKAYFPSDYATLKTLLLNDDRFMPVQKAVENVVPLIDWKWLLAIMAFSLAAEWFLRKYNGLI